MTSHTGHWSNQSQATADFGYYVSPALRSLTELVADALYLSIDTIRGDKRGARIVDARSIVAVLADELLSVTQMQVEAVLLRANGLAGWYITRHLDRLKASPGRYGEAYAKCRALARERFSAGRSLISPSDRAAPPSPMAAGLAHRPFPPCGPTISTTPNRGGECGRESACEEEGCGQEEGTTEGRAGQPREGRQGR